MAKNVKCSYCGEPATVYLTRIVDGQTIKFDLCDSCAQAKGIGGDFASVSLTGLHWIRKEADNPQLECSECGLTSAKFRSSGRLGCANCYNVFRSLINPVLQEIQMGTRHKGKIPKTALARQNSVAELQHLEAALQVAIRDEDYEEAAKYRDRIKRRKEDDETEGVPS